MDPKFTQFLCCPKTRVALNSRATELFANGMIKSGILTTTDGQNQYPIINGIPRFVAEEFYSDSFGYEWKKWAKVQYESENAGKSMAGHTSKMFETITTWPDELIKDKFVVEFGAGGGRFLDMVRKKGGIAVGIDLSMAVEPARENFKDDTHVLIIQGDVLNPPFKSDTFDLGYSIGVFHHTPNPARGLNQLVNVVKPQGSIACSVYPKKSFYDYSSVALYRKIYHGVKSKLGGNIATKLALGYAYFAAFALYCLFYIPKRIRYIRYLVHLLEKNFLVNLDLPDARWRVLDIFDAITPFYASTHTSEEVAQWFTEAHCREIHQTPWGNTSYVATKGNSSCAV